MSCVVFQLARCCRRVKSSSRCLHRFGSKKSEALSSSLCSPKYNSTSKLTAKWHCEALCCGWIKLLELKNEAYQFCRFTLWSKIQTVISTWPVLFINKSDLGMTAFTDSGQTVCLPILIFFVIVFIIQIVFFDLIKKKKRREREKKKRQDKSLTSLSVYISHSANCAPIAKVFSCLLSI